MFTIRLVLVLSLFIPQICFGAAATMYVTPAGAGDKSGDSWANAMGLGEWETDAEGAMEAGDIFYVAGGTYTLTANWDSALSGTAAAPITVIGVNAGTTNEPPETSDYATGSNRPLIVAGGYTFAWENCMVFRNLEVTSNYTYGWTADDYPLFVNCKATNTDGGAKDAFDLYTSVGGVLINCEAVGGDAIAVDGSGVRIIGCYIHDAVDGIDINTAYVFVANTIIKDCTNGIDNSSNVKGLTLLNTTIYNCTTGILGGTASSVISINNIFDGNTTGVSWTSEQKTNWFDYNCWDNDTDTTNVTWGDNRVEGDPSLTDPSGSPADFTLGSGSNCLDEGIQFEDIVSEGGLTGDYKWNIGVDQASGGGTLGWFGKQ